MTKLELINQINEKRSLLCVGLDTEISKLPAHLPKNIEGIFEFNKNIIKATLPYSVAYKINTAFYEQYGADGWQCMNETLQLIPRNCFTIADAKRGDIGNTSSMYARAFFETMNFDAITVAPYMGKDSLQPFFEFKNKWVICLGLTSNKGSEDFQLLNVNNRPLYEEVMLKTSEWGNHENLMFVTGATKANQLKHLRDLFPEFFFLVPGVGAQGGSVIDVCENAKTSFGGLLINSSRGIIYASNGEDYAEKAKIEAQTIQSACNIS
ncbi:MAG: orotidine-5'-phosphate decarboxylase [Bacteroidota bacterium]|nr:orotidine-5'-phosphate decarboxylase [Bacteroidota bacterium]